MIRIAMATPLKRQRTLASSDQTRVVKLKRSVKGGVIQDCDIYIGRECKRGGWDLQQSKWANPFTAKMCNGSVIECLRRYRVWVESQPALLAQLDELKGKVLGCWCSPSPCHGNVLIDLLKKH